MFRRHRDFRHSFFGAVKENRELYFKLYEIRYAESLEDIGDNEEFLRLFDVYSPQNNVDWAVSLLTSLDDVKEIGEIYLK